MRRLPLLHVHLQQDTPQAPIILKAGPLNGIFPTITKGISHFKSPLTGEWGESYAEGRLALAMRFAKAEPIGVREASESPCYISINDAKIEIKDVTSIWEWMPGPRWSSRGSTSRAWEGGASCA